MATGGKDVIKVKIVTKDNINSILLAGESNTVEFKAMTRGAIRFCLELLVPLLIPKVES